MADDFNYDPKDPKLNDKGLPVYTDDEEGGEESVEAGGASSNNSNNQTDETPEQTEDQSINAQDIAESLFYTERLTTSSAKMTTLISQLDFMKAPPTPQVLTIAQMHALKEARSIANNKSFKRLHPIKTAKLKSMVRKADFRILKLKATYWIQKLYPILPYIGIALLILLAIIIIVLAIGSIVSFFAGKTDPANMSGNEFITTEYFYGIRTAYLDEAALKNSLQLSYKQYVIDVVENLNENNPGITINITLPEISSDSPLTNETNVDTNILNMSLAIANIVATGSNSYSGIDIATLYPQIEYFGFTTEQGDLVNDFISDYLISNNLVTPPEGSDANDIINSTLSDDVDLKYVYNRCEKVMIKDEIATESGISGVEQRQYIGSIYMPNKNIIIDSETYAIASETEPFTCTSKLIFNQDGSETILDEELTDDAANIVTGFVVDQVDLPTFTSIDSENLTAFANGVSIFEAMRIAHLNGTTYFTQNAETGAYTWKPADSTYLYFTFEASSIFIFNDFHLNAEAK